MSDINMWSSCRYCLCPISMFGPLIDILYVWQWGLRRAGPTSLLGQERAAPENPRPRPGWEQVSVSIWNQVTVQGTTKLLSSSIYMYFNEIRMYINFCLHLRYIYNFCEHLFAVNIYHFKPLHANVNGFIVKTCCCKQLVVYQKFVKQSSC